MSEAPFDRRAALRVGTTLGGKYRLERVLGVGGMATVYAAVHRNGHRVAVKVLHEDLSHRGDTRARFLREGYVANRIGHAGAVRIVDDDVAEDGAAYLVMELLRGETLRARLARRGGRLPCREVLALGHQLLDVLAAAHAAGIVHRDIKPENLFLTTEPALKVLDFGIARIEDDPGGLATATGMRLGTPAFMPPELALGRTAEIDARTDLWSAGATMFQLLSGELVHTAAGAAELVVRAATVHARSLAVVAPETPGDVVALVDKALAFARDDRWATAEAMQQAIEEAHLALCAEGVSALSIGPVPETHPYEGDADSPRAPSGSRSTPRAGRRARAGATTQESPPSRPSARPPTDTLASPSPELPRPESRARKAPAPSASGPETTLPAPTDEPAAATAPPSAPGDSASPQTATPPLQTATPTAAPQTATPPPQTATPTPAPKTATSAPQTATSAPQTAAPSPRTAPGAPQRDRNVLAGLLVAALAAGGTWAAWRYAAEKASPGAQSGAVGPASPAPRAEGCKSHKECTAAHGGRPHLCHPEDGVCSPLESEDCHALGGPGDAENDATVWVGAMWPVGEPDPLHYGPRARNALALARLDFAETSGGLPPVRPGGPKRPIGIVLCDDREKPERAADHLVQDVRVPAILGFRSSKEILDLATSHLLPRGVAAIVATGSAATLRNIPHPAGEPRLVWRVTIATDQATLPFAAVVQTVFEPEIRAAAGALKPGEPIRVAQLRQESLAGQSTVDSRMTALRYNGKSVAENGDAFRQIARADAFVASDPTAVAANERTARDVAAFLPHVVLDMPPNPALLLAIERLWPASAPFRPRYLTEGTWADLGPASLDWRRGQLYKRLYSVDFPSGGAAVVRFALRYNELTSPRVTPATAPTAPYDAFYLFAYAAAAVGERPLTGGAIARAIARLQPPGEAIDVGPGDIYPAFLALSTGRNIDLRGTGTSLDLDPETGDTGADFALYCVAPGAPGETVRQVESGLVWDSRRRSLTGTLVCP